MSSLLTPEVLEDLKRQGHLSDDLAREFTPGVDPTTQVVPASGPPVQGPAQPTVQFNPENRIENRAFLAQQGGIAHPGQDPLNPTDPPAEYEVLEDIQGQYPGQLVREHTTGAKKFIPAYGPKATEPVHIGKDDSYSPELGESLTEDAVKKQRATDWRSKQIQGLPSMLSENDPQIQQEIMRMRSDPEWVTIDQFAEVDRKDIQDRFGGKAIGVYLGDVSKEEFMDIHAALQRGAQERKEQKAQKLQGLGLTPEQMQAIMILLEE